jgi:glycosyltransferase involved in cell wall biosynthesis
MNFKDQIFINPNKIIRDDTEVIFVADLFENDYAGGAEMTSEAIIQRAPYKVQKIYSKDLNISLLNQGLKKFWLFGNFSQINPELIPSIVANLKYSILEYDYKYCKYRSPEKHQTVAGQQCDCHEQMNGKLVSAFYYGSQALWWMSENQKNHYFSLFPFLRERDNIVLSSVFSSKTLATLRLLRNSLKNEKKSGWIVLGSQSWVKGFEEAKKWCEDNNKTYEVVWDLPYENLLAKMASSEGFVYLPAGGDTCPRMVIEAKLLGCNLQINENVQHKNEEWFNTNDLDSIEEYLSLSPDIFWKTISNIINKKPTISGYITTYNCKKQGYPYVQAIKSMLGFCDEVCIVDGGSTDGTFETLDNLRASDPSRVKLKKIARDWGHPRHAVFDGLQKAEARDMCTSEFCWQMDSDEVVHEDDYQKIIDLCKKFPANVEILSLPVIEYWGGPEKIRADIQPWKWRLSRNLPHITHGIPSHLRRQDELGTYALQGTDGCDMIHKETGQIINHLTFHNEESERVRIAAISGNIEAISVYQSWFNQIIENIPGVYHYSWYDIPRKMRLYRDYWTRHWNSLFRGSLEDTSETNMMFDVPWSQVTEEMIEEKAKLLLEKTGGWIWHRKWDGTNIPHIKIARSQPRIMNDE